MTIDIKQTRLRALICKRMAGGQFLTVEDALMQALESAPMPQSLHQEPTSRTGAALVAAMQAMPSNNTEFDHARLHLPVRDAEF